MLTTMIVVAVVWLTLIILILIFFHGARLLGARRGRRPLDTDATVTYISDKQKGGNR